MSKVINVHDAKTHFSKLIARVEKGERITVARSGKPVACLVPVDLRDAEALPLDDPILNLDNFGFKGPGSSLSNSEIDRIVYER
jgi:prevent-host-death family protein